MNSKELRFEWCQCSSIEFGLFFVLMDSKRGMCFEEACGYPVAISWTMVEAKSMLFCMLDDLNLVTNCKVLVAAMVVLCRVTLELN